MSNPLNATTTSSNFLKSFRRLGKKPRPSSSDASPPAYSETISADDPTRDANADDNAAKRDPTRLPRNDSATQREQAYVIAETQKQCALATQAREEADRAREEALRVRTEALRFRDQTALERLGGEAARENVRHELEQASVLFKLFLKWSIARAVAEIAKDERPGEPVPEESANGEIGAYRRVASAARREVSKKRAAMRTRTDPGERAVEREWEDILTYELVALMCDWREQRAKGETSA